MNEERLTELLSSFSGKKLLVVGDVVLDHYVNGAVERLNPEAPVPVLHAQSERDETGAAGNVAKNAAALGAEVTLVSVVGEDDTAAAIAAAAEREGYAVKLVPDASRPSIRKTRFLAGGQQLLRVDSEQTGDISAAVAEQLVAAVREAAAGVDAILVSDYAKGAITEQTAKESIALAAAADVPLAADVKPSRIRFFTGATFISPNLKEGHEYLGKNHLEQGGVEPAALAQELKETFKTDVYLTLGADGIEVCTETAALHLPQDHIVDIADTSGAGDTSVVVMMLARLAGATPREVATLVNAAGAVVVSKIGAVGVSQPEIRDRILDRVDHTHTADD